MDTKNRKMRNLVEDRRSDSHLRQSIEQFDQVAESEDFDRVAECFFEIFSTINDYSGVFLALPVEYQHNSYNVIAKHPRGGYGHGNTLPVCIQASVLEAFSSLSSWSSCASLVPALIDQVDFSLLGWEKPGNLDLFPLRYQGNYLGILVCNSTKHEKRRVRENTRLQVLFLRFVEFVANACRPDLIGNDIVPELSNKEDLQIEAFIHSPIPIVITNENFKIDACNRAAEEFFEIAGSEFEQRTLAALVPEINHNQQLMMSQANKARSFEYEVPVITRTGRQKVGAASFRYLSWSGRNYWWVSIVDLTKQRHYESLHKSHTQRLQTISDVTPTGLLQTNGDWEVIYANDMWCELTGNQKEDLKGFNWLQFIAPDDIERLLTELKMNIDGERMFATKVRSTSFFQTGKEWFNLKAKSLPDGEGLVICLEDITKQEQQTQRLLTMASTDPLTELTNRAFFFDRLTQACHFAHRSHGFSLLSIDLDNFKWINDSLGHNVGDLALRVVSHHLLHCVRDTDTVARIGGDEFMILLPGCNDPHQVLRIAEKIISGSKDLSLFPTELSLSVGIALVENGQKIETNELLKQADFALYSAKRAGKKQACFYSTELSVTLERQLQITQQLRMALKNKQFEVFYQLVWNSDSNCFVGAEALLRWHHPEESLLSPDSFMQALEADGGIQEVTLYVIEESLKALKDWINKGLVHETAHIAVNFSPKLFRIKDLPQKVAGLLQQQQMKGSSLMVEITESTLLDDEVAAQTMISKLQSLGVKVALDDFGTGYSPLAYLTKFTIDCIKIDKSFVYDVHSKRNQAIIRAISSLANDLDLVLITEGVENNQSYQYIQSLDCRLYQGYLFHQPQSRYEAEESLVTMNQNEFSSAGKQNPVVNEDHTRH